MDKKEVIIYLRSYKELQREIILIKNKINDLRRMIEEPKGMTISDIGPIDGGKHAPRHEQIALLVDLTSQYESMIVIAENKCLEITKKIDKLNCDNEKNVLKMYFCATNNLKLFHIANELNYSYGYVRNLLMRGIDHLAEIM